MDQALDQTINTIIEAAKSVGFDMPPEGVSEEQLPQVYQQLLAKRAQSKYLSGTRSKDWLPGGRRW